MDWETGFFRWIWRFNALALAGVLIIGGLVALFALATIVLDLTRDRSVSNLVDPRPEARRSAEEQVGALTPLGDSGLLWARATRRSRGALAYASKNISATIDYVVYDPATGESRFLLGRRPSLIVDAQLLRAPRRADAEAEARSPAPVLALAVTFVDKDGDGDGRLSLEDPITLALADPTGEALTVVATGEEVLGVHTMSETLAIATLRQKTESGVRTAVVHLDLAARRAIRREWLPSGPDSAE